MGSSRKLALILPVFLLLIPTMAFTDNCGPNLNLTVIESQFSSDDFTPVNRTIQYSGAVPIVYRFNISDSTTNVTLKLQYNDSHFQTTDTHSVSRPVANTNNKFVFDLPVDTVYNVTLTLTNSTNQNCNLTYFMNVNRSGLNDEKAFSLLIIFLIFGLLAVSTLVVIFSFRKVEENL